VRRWRSAVPRSLTRAPPAKAQPEQGTAAGQRARPAAEAPSRGRGRRRRRRRSTSGESRRARWRTPPPVLTLPAASRARPSIGLPPALALHSGKYPASLDADPHFHTPQRQTGASSGMTTRRRSRRSSETAGRAWRAVSLAPLAARRGCAREPSTRCLGGTQPPQQQSISVQRRAAAPCGHSVDAVLHTSAMLLIVASQHPCDGRGCVKGPAGREGVRKPCVLPPRGPEKPQPPISCASSRAPAPEMRSKGRVQYPAHAEASSKEGPEHITGRVECVQGSLSTTPDACDGPPAHVCRARCTSDELKQHVRRQNVFAVSLMYGGQLHQTCCVVSQSLMRTSEVILASCVRR
jgi:hypothetical protein